MFFIVFAISYRSTRKSALAVIAAIRGRLLYLFLVYVTYFACILAGASWFGLWRHSMLGESLAWFVFSGVPIFAKFVSVASEKRFFRNYLMGLVGFGATIAFLVTIATFHLAIEVFLAILVTFLMVVREVARMKIATHGVAKFLNGALGLVGILILANSAYRIIADWTSLDLTQVALSFGMAVWLPAAMIPFILALSVISEYELQFLRMSFLSGHANQWLARFALVRELGILRPRLIRGFAGAWRWELRQAESWPSAHEVVRVYRFSERQTLLKIHREEVVKIARLANVGHGYYYSPAVDQKSVRRILKIVRERQPGWEYKLYEAALVHMIAHVDAWGSLQRRSHAVLAEKEISPQAASILMQRHAERMLEVTDVVAAAFDSDVMEEAFGEPGEAGNPTAIVHLSGLLVSAYSTLGDLMQETALAIPSREELISAAVMRPTMEVTTQIANFADNVEAQFAGLTGRIAQGGPIEVELTLELSISEQATEAWQRALAHVAEAG